MRGVAYEDLGQETFASGAVLRSSAVCLYLFNFVFWGVGSNSPPPHLGRVSEISIGDQPLGVHMIKHRNVASKGGNQDMPANI